MYTYLTASLITLYVQHDNMDNLQRVTTTECTTETNDKCPQYLSIHVAEHILKQVFENVKQMPPNTVGHDFICDDKMVDVKGSCLGKGTNHGWTFIIRKNSIADLFLCLAFDNRENLNLMYMWLIPGEVVNDKHGVGVSPNTVSKWDEYKLDISKAIVYCDDFKKLIDEQAPLININNITLPTLHCFQCGHDWHPRNNQLPKVCPICKRTNWNIQQEREWEK